MHGVDLTSSGQTEGGQCGRRKTSFLPPPLEGVVVLRVLPRVTVVVVVVVGAPVMRLGRMDGC
jgi:hypothetical protein